MSSCLCCSGYDAPGLDRAAQARVEDQIKSLGSNLIIILSGNFTSGGVRMGSGSQLTITEDDAYALQREVSGVHAAAPQLRVTEERPKRSASGYSL